jgi:hypothetical protein
MRYCDHCGNRLAQDNTESSCSACLRHTALGPPSLPPGFWDTDQMRDALATWHMGKVLCAYRTHPHHGRVLSQDLVASWLGLTQAQLSRIENGKAPDALSKLIHYAVVLGIPDKLLWFSVPKQQPAPAQVSAPARHGAARELSLGKLQAASDRPPRVLEALTTAMSGHGTLDVLSDDLAELVPYYAYALSVTPSAAVYDELLSVRSAADALLNRREERAGQRTDLIVTAGWLSSLLAISASDMGEHAAALVWCADTGRRGREGGHPELLGWATLTRALIAYYQGQAQRSVAFAAQGQALTSVGSVVYAKLAAQEMRARALLGDVEGMALAQRQATLALERLSPETAVGGVFSIPLAADPPYTATSLLLIGKYQAAADITSQLVDTVYRKKARTPYEQPTNYARTLLILGLAEAGLGQLDKAAATGTTALGCSRPVWPTMVLAGKLDRELTTRSPRPTEASDYHDRYLEAVEGLPYPLQVES